MRSKAELRALRESAGITQHAMAKELDVEVRAIKRWESLAAPQQAPQDAWDVVDIACDNQRYFIAVILDKLLGAESVVLPYWASQEEYEETAGDLLKWTEEYREANANMRAARIALLTHHVWVTWVDGIAFDGSFHPEFGAPEEGDA